MNFPLKGENFRTVAYVERSAEDFRVQAPRMSRISLALPSDARLRRDIMPDARTGPYMGKVAPVQDHPSVKPTRIVMSREKSREVLLEWLKKQTEAKSTYEMAEDPDLIAAMGKKFTSGTIWARLRQLHKQGLVNSEKRKSSRNGSWAMVAYWSAAK